MLFSNMFSEVSLSAALVEVLWLEGRGPLGIGIIKYITIMPLFQLARFLEDDLRASETLAELRLRIDEDFAHIIDPPL